jgi:quercetin dioxygenase-like cupin family protein
MRIVRSDEVTAMSSPPAEAVPFTGPQWLEGPLFADRLDVGMVALSHGGVTGPHAHIGGQVMVVTAGNGFVETDSERVELATGDVVIALPGELHTHGALPGKDFSHLTVTTGGVRFPDPA